MSAILISVLTIILCLFTSACGAGNAEIFEMTICYPWQSFRPGYSLGAAFKYGIEDAETEMYIESDNSVIIFDCSEDIKDLDKYEYGSKPAGKYPGTKEYTRSKGSLFYVNTPVFQIRPVKGWDFHHTSEWWNEYVAVIVRKDGKIVGYAVMYFYAAGAKINSSDEFEVEFGKGKVLADKEVLNMSEEAVKERIQKVIDGHKNGNR